MRVIKVVTCIIVHFFLLVLSISNYKLYQKKETIMENTSPIKVYIKDIHYRAKSSDTCDVIYNGKEYKDIIFYRNDVKMNTFNNHFYYDTEKDWIFCKGNEKTLMIAYLLAFVLSFLLWFLPKEKFRLSW